MVWRLLNLFLFVGVFFADAERCYAGFLFTIGPNWNNFVFEAERNEDTPNYYGYGGRMSWGYSVGQVADFGLYTQYSPGRLNSAMPPRTDAALMDYGAEVGFRLANVLYVGARGGMWKYQLFKAFQDNEIRGAWLGLGGTISVGMLMPISKRTSWQTSLDMGQGVLQQLKGATSATTTRYRKLSRVGVTLAFVYNDDGVSSVAESLFNSLF